MSVQLSFDTTHSIGSLYLKTSECSELVSWQSDKSHSEIIFEKMENLLSKFSLRPKDLSELIVNFGPGSFTGIRISVNIVKTLSYTLNIPIFAYNSLDVVDYNINQTPLLVGVNAYSGLCYTKEKSSSNIQVLNIDQINNILKTQKYFLAGDFFHLNKDQLVSHSQLLPLEDGLSDAKKLLQRHESEPSELLKWSDLNPFYVRKSSPEEKLNL